jgi:hypothetical protein
MQLILVVISLFFFLSEWITTASATVTQFIKSFAILEIEQLVDISAFYGHSNDLYRRLC